MDDSRIDIADVCVYTCVCKDLSHYRISMDSIGVWSSMRRFSKALQHVLPRSRGLTVGVSGTCHNTKFCIE